MGQRNFYEGSGPTLDAALAKMPEPKDPSRLARIQIGVEIMEGTKRVTCVIGTHYEHVAETARNIADHNTGGDFLRSGNNYQTKVSVSGYYS